MKLIHSNTPLIHSDDMPSSTMGMDSKGMEMATFYLRDKIYSDKIAAVVREYICNALDEHKKYNIDAPVKITLKDGVYSVRDFANGLSEHDVRNVFGMYFRSTKSADNNQTGGFGLGSKAGFCYTDTFYVKSFYQGVVTTYACSLGAGQSGVSVGQILKISEEQTDESGLEVSLEINSKDFADFIYKTKQFLSTCIQNAEFHDLDAVDSSLRYFVNAQPVKTIKINDFTFNLVPNPKGWNLYNCVYFCMGNVCYKKYYFHQHFNKKFKNDIIKDHYIIIDVPIGKMSLPISRESFEDTANNKRILEEIQQAFEELQEQESKNIKTLSIKELIDSRDEFFQNTEWFTFRKNSLYAPEIYNVVCNMKSYVGEQTLPLEKKDGKYIVALIPNKESADYWIEKFCDHLNDVNKNYYYINERFLNENNIKEFENLFLFKKVKSTIFGWPKNDSVEKNGLDAEYTISHLFGSRWSAYKEQLNALELHNMVFKNNATDEQSAKNDFVNYKFESFLDLNNVSIKKSFGPGEHVFSTTSKKMVENMKLLGWYEVGSAEYLAKKQEIQQFLDKKQEQLLKLTECRLNFLNNNSSFLDKLKKKEKYINKYRQILFNIKKENSLRNNLLKGLEYNSWNAPKISRKQLRTILKIKD